MSDLLSITTIQTNLVWENAIQNRLQLEKKINSIENKTDIVILPEMFTTGFSMHPEKLAESIDGDTIGWMKKMAREKQLAICGSLIIEESQQYYNRFLFIEPNGKITHYDKRHLFTLANEHDSYVQGLERVVINYKNWKISPIVCYDLRFPVWIRNVENFDLLICVANWPKTRIGAWNILLKARAIENMCYTVGVNRVGLDANNLEYTGSSQILNCLGQELIKVTTDKEIIETVVITKEHLNKTREKLNFLNDKDEFILR